ncbi:zinc-binding dehydrogenase [Thermodesulfobacteriota bacterium]
MITENPNAKSMQAAIFYGPRDIRVEEIPLPGIGEEEVLVQVKACGICGSDLHFYRSGMFEDDVSRPMGNGRIMGHEFSGVVSEMGAKVKDFLIGDRITGLGMGGFAEYVPLPVNTYSSHRLPENISFEEGTTLEPLASSVHAAEVAGPAEGETVVILGAGIIGLGCLQVIRAAVACPVIVVDMSPIRLNMAEQLGADVTINLKETDPREAVMEFTSREGKKGGAGADLVIDCAGVKSSPVQGFRMLKKYGGRLIVAALYEEQPDLDFNEFNSMNASMHASWGWTGHDYRRAIELVQTGRVERNLLISHEYPLKEAPAAFTTQADPEVSIKVLIKP